MFAHCRCNSCRPNEGPICSAFSSVFGISRYSVTCFHVALKSSLPVIRWHSMQCRLNQENSMKWAIQKTLVRNLLSASYSVTLWIQSIVRTKWPNRVVIFHSNKTSLNTDFRIFVSAVARILVTLTCSWSKKGDLQKCEKQCRIKRCVGERAIAAVSAKVPSAVCGTNLSVSGRRVYSLCSQHEAWRR
jgi:hypothetical protein